jgi:hypothetical protein
MNNENNPKKSRQQLWQEHVDYARGESADSSTACGTYAGPVPDGFMPEVSPAPSPQPATGTPRTGLVTIAKGTLEHLSRDTLLCYIDQLERELAEAVSSQDALRNEFDRREEVVNRLRSQLTAQREAHERDVGELRAKQPINSHRRLFDLVRFMRSELHEADLIDADEYAWLCSHEFKEDKGKPGSPSPRRLEDYDDLRTRLTAAERRLAEQTAKLALADELAGALERIEKNLKIMVPTGDALLIATDALTRYRAASAPTTATKGEGV